MWSLLGWQQQPPQATPPLPPPTLPHSVWVLHVDRSADNRFTPISLEIDDPRDYFAVRAAVAAVLAAERDPCGGGGDETVSIVRQAQNRVLWYRISHEQPLQGIVMDYDPLRGFGEPTQNGATHIVWPQPLQLPSHHIERPRVADSSSSTCCPTADGQDSTPQEIPHESLLDDARAGLTYALPEFVLDGPPTSVAPSKLVVAHATTRPKRTRVVKRTKY